MEIKALRKKTITKSAVYGVLLACVISISTYLGGVSDSIDEKYNFLKNDITALSRKLDGLSEKALEFSESARVWEEFTPEQQKLQGLRINLAKDLMDRLQTEYKISNVKMSFSKPEELKEVYVTDTVSVVSSDVNIDFSSITDENVFNFIGAVMAEYPGYVQINSLSIVRTKDVEKGVLVDIAEGKIPSMVDVRMNFSWRDLKYKGPVANAEKEPENQ
ncbi:MAG: putative rane protein [Rickettsiaceae bacterium]|jgi:hypothetical protein|nr:putative rane protein [Rickettsiaceae bacterium]